MALHWDFNKKIGHVKELINGEEYEFSLYNGNAELICLWEDDKQWNMHWFWTSRDHAKNMLGTSKEYKGECSHLDTTEWYFEKECKDLDWIIKEILKTKINCKIIINTIKAPF